MYTPTTKEGLEKFDELPAFYAVAKAWAEPGANPEWHYRAQNYVREAMPVLARNLDKLAKQFNEFGKLTGKDQGSVMRKVSKTISKKLIKAGADALTRDANSLITFEEVARIVLRATAPTLEREAFNRGYETAKALYVKEYKNGH